MLKKLLLILFLSPLSISVLLGQDLYDSSRIQEIKLYFSQPNWDYLLDTAASGSESYIFCRRAVINGVVFDSVGAKYKGNSSFNVTRAKNPWHIELDHYKDLNYGGIKDIKLSNIFADPSQIREALSYEILQKYMNAPRANFAKVWVNDTLIGLYTNTEAITKSFCKREFQSVSNNNAFFKCTPPVPVVGGVRQSPNLSYLGADSSLYFLPYEKKSNYGWQDLVRLTDTIKNNFANIENTMDIDRAIWMLAFNNVFVNLDSYTGSISHNYYLWKDDNQRWNPIVWDINMSFAAFRILLVGGGSNPSIDTATAITMSPFLHQNAASRPLIQGILNNPQYRRMYIAHMRTMLNENFRNNAYKLSALRWQNQIDAAVQEDPNKFTTYPQFKTNLR
jgi:spore coat protein CotH